jgi:hypothetical protein
MGSYLTEGAPKVWFTGIRKHSLELLDDFAGFTNIFKVHFGDPDYRGTAQRHLDAL